jgi:pimeloyl-ACP methyl ester carboxylesterase
MEFLKGTIDRRSALKLIGAAGAWSAWSPAMPTAQSDIQGFKVRISDEELADLRRRLSEVRWPPDATGKPWSMGTDLAFMKQLVAYWKDKYDWRAQETALNSFDQYTTTIDGYRIHFIHQKSRNASALPLMLTHGYPGSIWEMLPPVAALVDPAAHGGAVADSFHVIVPALPGYPFSGEPLESFSPDKVPDLWVKLMDKLGYKRFGAYGSDWGAGITTQLGTRYPDRVVGTAVPGPPPRTIREPRTAEERAYYESMERYNAEETAYQLIQGTKPQSLAYGLTDSPTAVAAWVVEKLRAWSDCNGNPENKFTKDQIVTLASLYWFTRSLGTAVRIYYSMGRFRTPPAPRNIGIAAVPDARAIQAAQQHEQRQAGGRRVPQGYFDFIGITSRARPPKSLVDKIPDNVTLWSYHDKGGHFPAIEEPKLLVEDLRTFFRPLRSA